MLQLKTVAYQIGEGGSKTPVPSFANVSGGSGCAPPPLSDECEEESLFWFLNIPIDSAEALAQLRALSNKVAAEKRLSPEERQESENHIRDLESHPEELAEAVRQYRPGHFLVECHIMDGDRPWAVGDIELEVLFKGNAFDQLLKK